MNILCTICIRSGSEGLKNKGLMKINGKPLFYYTLKQAKKIKFFSNIVVSTNSQKISNSFLRYGLKSFFLRPKKLSNSKAGKIDVIRDALLRSEKFYNKKFDIIFDLDVTSPLRNVSDIKKAYKIFNNNKADILFSVCKARKNPYFNIIEKKKKSNKTC